MDLSAITTLLVLGSGLVLAHGVSLAYRVPAAWPQSLAWAPAVGFGALSLVFFGWRISGLPGAARGSVPVLALLAAAAFAAARLRDRSRSGEPAPAARREALVPPAVRWASRGALAVTVLGLLVAFVRWTTRWPLGTTDAINIWNVRARLLLFADGTVPEILHLTQRGHPDYPLLLPASIAAQAGFWGDWNQALPQVTGLGFLAGLGFMVYLALRRLTTSHTAAAGTALLLASPPVWRWAFAQCADLPLAYLVLAAGVGLASLLPPTAERPMPPVLTGFALGLLPWTKNDGLILLGALGTVFALFLFLRPRALRPGRRALAGLLAGTLPGLAALAAFKALWAPPGAAGLFLGSSPAAKLLDAERWSTVLTTAAATLNPMPASSLWRWIALSLILLLVVAGLRRSRVPAPCGFIFASLCLAAAGYLTIYVLSPYELVWHVSKSADRLSLQLLPLLMVWAFALAGAPGEKAADPAAVPSGREAT